MVAFRGEWTLSGEEEQTSLYTFRTSPYFMPVTGLHPEIKLISCLNCS